MRKILVIVAAVVVLAFVGLVVLGLTVGTPRSSLAIVAGSENKALEPIIMEWAQGNRVDVSVDFQGSVDISRILQQGREGQYDAVWPANSLWIELGDSEKVVKHSESILRSPVVLGLKRSIAERLGWIGRDDITIQDIQLAAADGAFRLSMTSATQSNSGASAYFGFLYALSDNPDILTMEDLNDQAVQDKVRALLSEVDRSSGSSGWLKDSLVENPATFDAMFNYEALVIEANQELARRGVETLYTIYPANGLSVADSPLGYVDKGDTAKDEAFVSLQEHLLSAPVQEQLVYLGRRAGLLGLDAAQADRSVWNPDWGVDPGRSIASIPIPAPEVIGEALRLYQTELRKPSLTVWILDVSGSMEGAPLEQLKQAMHLLLEPESAALNLLQPSSRDITVILPFNHDTGEPLTINGGAPADLEAALRRIDALQADGGTDLYRAIWTALDVLDPYYQDGTLFDYLPAIVAMTDGASAPDNRDGLMEQMKVRAYGRDIPVHAIAFGQADEAQLDELNAETVGRLFKAGDDLAGALRSAKGYN